MDLTSSHHSLALLFYSLRAEINPLRDCRHDFIGTEKGRGRPFDDLSDVPVLRA